MSPSLKSKSKSKEKASARARKEQQKCSPKTSVTTNHGSGIPTTTYNPISGTFHTLETLLVASSAPLHDNSHFLKIDDTDDHSSSPQGTVSECDSFSNNGSCSGESEDHKEKVANMRLDTIPGCDNEKREKIRLKNERKHQRQRERRAQELHDRCSGYLMSRKLEALSKQLVAMGFSSERATLALMLNDGKLEESVSWLFEGNEDESHTKDTTTNLLSEGNLKIDISEELAQLSAMEVRYNCSKQEVEKVVVACEGDIQKAENTLKSQKQESPVIQSKSEDSARNNSLVRSQGLPTASVSMQQRGNDSDFYHSKVGGGASMLPDPESKNLQSLHSNHQIEPTDKRWGVTGSSPSTMLMMPPSMQARSPFAKVDAQPSALWNEGRMIQQGFGRERVVMMQNPQFTNAKQNSVSSINALPSGTEGWHANNILSAENTRSNGRLLQNRDIGSAGTQSVEKFCQSPYNEYSNVFGPVDSLSSGVGGFYKPMHASSPSPSPTIHPQHQGSWSARASSPALTFPPSLGLFSGHQNAADRTFSPHLHVDWNNGGLMPEFDYTNIDWTFYTLDCRPSPESGGLLLGISSLLRNSSGSKMMGSSSYMAGLQNGGMAKESSTSAGLREWTTPFAGKDIFSVPRQFVTSTPL
ncbi:hypothetical protein TanjilG_06677 [Lupinus angustifolius]|uniref:UBA domain-containing protein n=1 Tax=Lupinus angustifolius TaxID=3871 RepID=A0A1J7H5U6_LUPAN|nr:PREDICTED: uncharacterized protein LOC109352019 [Lupinus angustifolius]OIW08134.1 hypothetical protein TanjilG_06677 [Lupinus angustifolius]